MKLTGLPDDVVGRIVEHLTMEGLAVCALLCRRWRAVVHTDPVLAARIDLQKAVKIFNAKAQLVCRQAIGIGSGSGSGIDVV